METRLVFSLAKFKQWAEGTSSPVPGWAIACDGRVVTEGDVLDNDGMLIAKSCPQWEEEVDIWDC